ncbi:MAG: hypothetical protein GC160_23350 [Acidobacteria bacterium]|nr:hypothetical protein [Acidobacteriota bacterium]
MQFSATITAVAPNPTDIANWEVGILQTITRCERTALYSNHIARRVRLDTSFGGLKDGSNGELYYVGSSDFQAAATPNTYTAQVYESDSPNFEAPLTYSGNAATPFAGWPQQLAATEGRDEFVTFLAAVDSSTHSIVTLGRCVWVVDWRGSFDRKTKTWTPRDVADILDYNLVNLGSAYEDLTNQDYGKVPMSLFLSEAEEAFQIYDGAAWQGCSPRGMIDGRHLTLTRWV